MLESSLKKLAERILGLDEASLSALLEKYRLRMEQFDGSREWERSVIIFFIINSVRMKNKIFNDRILQRNAPPRKKPADKPDLKLVK